MTGWILNITGMVFITVILEIVLPTGKTNSFIKMIFGVFLLYIIVSPIPKIFNKDIILNSNNLQNQTNNTNYVIALNLNKISALENDIKINLNKLGFENVGVVVSADIYNEEFIVKKIYVDLIQMVLNKPDEHININKEIKDSIMGTVYIKEGDIVFYG